MKTTYPSQRYSEGSHRGRPGGFTMIEVVVSAGLLLVLMSFLLKMTYRVGSIWTDIGHHRSAINELSNQIDRLTLLTESELAKELASLELSAEGSATLFDAALTGEVINDEFGRRLELRLTWNRRHPVAPTEMSAWIQRVDQNVIISPEPDSGIEE